MKTILVPTDFSDVSENAANYAFELSGYYEEATVLLLNIYSLPLVNSTAMPVSISFKEMEKESTKLIRAFDKKLKNKHTEVKTELITSPGFVVEEIQKIVEKRKIDLIVMTRKDKRESILGNNTTSVMKIPKQPILVIPKGVMFSRPKRVALACDHTSVIPDEVVRKVKEYVKLFNAKIFIFYVLKKAEPISLEKTAVETALEKSLADTDYSFHYIPGGDDLTYEINSFIDSMVIDTLVMIPHNYSFFKGIVHHSTTKDMAFHSHVPLLSIHE